MIRVALMGLALCALAGCGAAGPFTACADVLTASEYELAVDYLEQLRFQGFGRDQAILAGAQGCPYDIDCRRCWEQLVNEVY